MKAQAQSQDADQDIRDFQALAAELNDNVKNTQPTPGSGPRSRFTLPMPDNAQNRARAQRAAEIAAQRPPDPAYFTLRERAERAPPTPPPTMTRSTVTVPLRPPDRAVTTTTRTMRARPAPAVINTRCVGRTHVFLAGRPCRRSHAVPANRGESSF